MFTFVVKIKLDFCFSLKFIVNMKSNQKQVDKSGSWWNRPLWGEQSFMEWLSSSFQKMKKEEIPEPTVALYRDLFTQLKNIGAMIKSVDNEKFSGKEFVKFLTLNREFEEQTGSFEGLRHSIDLLRVALETKDSFLKIEATETRYRSFSQQEFYNYIFDLLEKDLETDEFKKKAQRFSLEIIPKIRSEEGKVAIQSYLNQLDIVAKDKLGLKLLYYFKQYELTDFSLLNTVADIADSFYDKNLDSMKEFMVVVQVNSEIFLKLGQIIQVPKSKNIPDTYAVILYYIALKNRHGKSFGQFQQLLKLVRQWQKPYNSLIAILEGYPAEEYQQPPMFKENIPAIEYFNKYESYL